jgi:hypothetical protein
LELVYPRTGYRCDPTRHRNRPLKRGYEREWRHTQFSFRFPQHPLPLQSIPKPLRTCL